MLSIHDYWSAVPPHSNQGGSRDVDFPLGVRTACQGRWVEGVLLRRVDCDPTATVNTYKTEGSSLVLGEGVTPE